MCRNIKSLRSDIPATDEEFRLAALQYVRKVSGYRHPSRVNQQVFDHAVDEIAQATSRLIQGLVVRETSRVSGGGSSSSLSSRRIAGTPSGAS